jgi:hypothetical protein
MGIGYKHARICYRKLVQTTDQGLCPSRSACPFQIYQEIADAWFDLSQAARLHCAGVFDRVHYCVEPDSEFGFA